MTIIDGHNLLWALRETLGEQEIDGEIELCRALSRYFAATGDPGQIVFDGAGPKDTTEFEAIANPEVFFSGFDYDADGVIEERIKASTSPRQLTVVSSDRRLRKAATARQATTVKCDRFWEQVRKELARPATREQEPEAKREGLTEGETDKWLEVFGLDE